MARTRRRNPNLRKHAWLEENKLMLIAVIATLGIIGAYSAGLLPQFQTASIVSDTCDFTMMSIDDIKTVSNDPTFNNEKVYLITARVDKGGECIKANINQSDFQRFGITDMMLGDITVSAQLKDMSLDYKVYDDTVMYKIYESTGVSDLSEDIPYKKVNLLTTQASALGKYTDPTGQAPQLSHLGNFPAGGDVNKMLDIGKWAYVMPEASNLPYGKDLTGNWWTTHFGGIPFYRGKLIDTMPFNRYIVDFSIKQKGNVIATARMDEQNKIAALGTIARIKSTGGTIESVFPPQPGVDFAIVTGADGTPVAGKSKFVTKPRYSNYKTTMDEFVNFDNNYFVYSWSDMKGSIKATSVPVGVDIFIDNKYYGFTPITIDDVMTGRHTITAKKTGYADAIQEINLVPGQNNLGITLAKIPPPEIMITVTPATITVGQSATVTWSIKGVVTGTHFTQPTTEVVGTSGTKTINPTTSTTYELLASGVGGEKIGAARLTVNPLPPPPPPAPVARDPGVGRETITDKENTLNNMLGLMSSENVAPRDCIFDEKANVVTCRPPYPVTYPTFQIILKASSVALEINVGIPEIVSVVAPNRIIADEPSSVTVTFKNAGVVSDAFDVSLQSTPPLTSGVQQFTLAPDATGTAVLPFSGKEGVYKAKVVMQSKNNPLAKAEKELEITILKNELPGEIKKLEKQTDYLEDLIMGGFTQIIYLVGGVLGMLIILLIYVISKKK